MCLASVGALMATKPAAGRSATRRPSAKRPTKQPPNPAARATGGCPAKPRVGIASPATSFLGRDEHVAELASLLSDDRLVTFTGAPGIGKSRLALEVAGALAGGYPGGARLVELAPVTEAALVPAAVASALRVPEATGQSLTDTLVARLSQRSVLLVLDNCEHMLGACAKLVDCLLSGCPKLRVLATSREPLAVTGERVWQVPPLPVPSVEDDALPEELAGYAAVRLFVERAAAVQPGFALNTYVASAVAEVCRRLDGIPLAIELAAARVATLTPAEIARRLDDRFDLLTADSGSGRARHQTLQAALDWSYELLSSRERALLRRLSVFVAGFELEAAEAVCSVGTDESGGDVQPGEVPDLLARLVSKSLVVGSPNTRYGLLETIRAYAGERLEEVGEAAVLRDAHARYYLALAEQAEPELTGPGQAHWLERLEAERANVRSALEWSLSHGRQEWALRLAGALVLYWRVRCHFSEGREFLEVAASASDGRASRLRAKALWGAGFMALMAGDPDQAIPTLQEALDRFRELGDRQGCARVLLILGNCLQYRDDPSVRSLLEESAALAREAGDAWCLAHALGVAGLEHSYREELSAARPLLEECLAVARRSNDKQSLRIGLVGLGLVCVRQGDYPLAESLLEESVAVSRELGETYSEATGLEYLGKLAIGRGDYRRARELVDGALDLMPEVAPPLTHLPLLTLLAEVARAQGDRCDARILFEDAVTRAAPARPFAALQGLGELAAEEGDRGVARALFEEALGLARARGSTEGTADALEGLGELAREVGDLKRAAVLFDEALELRRQLGVAPGIVASVEALAGLDPAAVGYEHSARLLGAAQALREANGYARRPWQSSRYEGIMALIDRALGANGLAAALAEGARLSIEEAVVQVSRRRGRRGRPASGWSSLTKSEQDVAALAAEGLTNAEIAERLLVSPWTVKAHLSHTFEKLGLAGRTELAREVWRRDQQRLG